MNQQDSSKSPDAELNNLRQDLAQTKALLENLQQRKSSVLAMAVHDLRTPLAIIQGYSQLLAADINDVEDPRNEYVINILAHAVSLEKMIENLVALDQLERGQFRLSVKRIDLNERVSQAIAQVEGLTLLKNLKIALKSPVNRVWVRADGDQVDRVLYNLLSHATKYAQPGSELKIQVTGDDDFGQVTIVDPNRRLSKESLGRLFDVIDIGRDGASSLQGMDMGLVLARFIAEDHNGRLMASQKEGKGLTFALYLPIIED